MLSGHHGGLGLRGPGGGDGARHVIVDWEERQPVVGRDAGGDGQPDGAEYVIIINDECY